MMFSRVEWSIDWRHKTGDTPDHPWRGSGIAWGRTKREAIRNLFRGSWGVGGQASALNHRAAEFRKGNIEILSVKRWKR